MPRIFPAALLAALCALVAFPAAATATRTYVSFTGNDANTTYTCDATHPCRTFAVALTQTTAGGEILFLDATGYGRVTIDRSVSIIGNPGFFGGIGVGAGGGGIAVVINTPGVVVTLRGLNINSLGGTVGVSMTAGAKLSIENCVIYGFAASANAGISITTPATVRIVNSVIKDNWYGLYATGGATVDVSNSQFLSNSAEGIYALANDATTTSISVSDTAVTGSNFGIDALANNASGTAQISMIRSKVSNGVTGVNSESIAGTASVTLSDSMVTGNQYGLVQSGAGATLDSMGNNTVRKNSVANTTGTISTYSPI